MTRLLLFGFFAQFFICPLIFSRADLPTPAIQLSGFNLVKKTPLSVQFDQVKLGTVLIFLSTKCPCSNSYVPVLEKMAEKYEKAKEIQFLGVHSNFDEEVSKATEYFMAKKLSFPVLQDEGMRMADFYKAYKTPHAFIISPQGKVLFQGGVGSQSIYEDKKTTNYLEAALESLREGKEIEEKSVRTLGCIIKRPVKGSNEV